MKNYVTYTAPDGTETSLKLPALRAIELEEKLGGSIPEKVGELDKLTVSVEFIAAMLPDGDYKTRKARAAEMFDEMTAEEKTLADYEFLIMDVLVAAGFMKGEAVAIQKAAQTKQEAALAEAVRKLSQKASPQQSGQGSATATSGE